MIYIIRHGQTRWNLEERKQGRTDSPLTMTGFRQAMAIAEILRDLIPTIGNVKVYASPLYRTQQYAQIIFDYLGWNTDNINVEPSIQEHGFGAWEGLTDYEIEQKFPGEITKRKADWWNYQIPGGGESYELISHRVQDFLDKCNFDDINILITHEMISKVMRGKLEDLSQEDTLALNHPQNVIYQYHDEQIKEIRVADFVHHLQPQPC